MEQNAILSAIVYLAVVKALIATPSFDPALATKLNRGNVTVLVNINPPLSKFLAAYDKREFKNLETRRTFFYNNAKDFTKHSQKCVLKFLSRQRKTDPSLQFKAFTITNTVLIRNANFYLVKGILSACSKNVIQISESKVPNLVNVKTQNLGIPISTRVAVDFEENIIPWNIASIDAQKAWKLNATGNGVVVGVISAGIHPTHEALQGKQRETCGWYDPFDEERTPYDTDGLGTAAASIVLGATEFRHVGVAPDAQFISCRACKDSQCFSDEALLACLAFMSAPFDTKLLIGESPALAPHVLLWATPDSMILDSTFMQEVQNFMNYMNVLTVVPVGAGSSSLECASVNAFPGDKKVLSVSSVDKSNVVDSSNHFGPVNGSGIIKPNVCAPGVGVKAADHLNLFGYKFVSGTYIAAAHAAGAAALLIGLVDLPLQPDEILALLQEGATPIRTSGVCGGIEGTVFPNNMVGHGKINCSKSIARFL